MANESLIREIITRACCDAFQQKSQELAEEVARKAGAELARAGEELPLQPEPAAVPRERIKELLGGALLISGTRTQTETLETLLAAVSAITPGCGLMILRGAQASGWSCKGLTTRESFRHTVMDCAHGVGAEVVSTGAPVVAQASELDSDFRSAIDLEGSAQLLLVPIMLKGRVAALLLSLLKQSDDLAGVKILAQITQLVLELQALRKAAPHFPAEVPHQAVQQPTVAPEPEPAAERLEAALSTPEHQAPQAPEPEAIEAKSPTIEIAPLTPPPSEPEAAPQAAEPEPAYTAPHVVESAPPPSAAMVGTSAPPPPRLEPAYLASDNGSRTLASPPAPIAQIAAPVSQTRPAPLPFGQPLPGDVHEKARRFAKLLVEEIKLYNQTKLAEGRARGDLYRRLHDDIEKSRGAYQKRFGESVKDIDYFTQELLRILADNNRAVMGEGFPG